MKQYNSENVEIGSIIGTYDPENRETCWSYILIGDKDNQMVKLLNFTNGKVMKMNRRFLYVQGIPKNGRYLDYDQEAMMKGDLVRFRTSKIPFKITKIHAASQTCDLETSELDFPVLNAPLSYLRYVRHEDSVKAREGIEVEPAREWQVKRNYNRK